MFFFFFSSRRRHTRWNCDWSSDVCSSDLRPLDLVEVARKLYKQLDFKLHVFGEGPLQEPLKAAVASHHLENRFVLHGYWDKGSAGMLEQIQLLVHSDGVEPFGGALLEAQLAGRPVVAYRVGGNPEIVEHGA